MLAKTVEELEAQLKTAVNTIERIDLLNAFIRSFSDVNPTQALALSQRAHDLAQLHPSYTQGLYASLLNLSTCNARLGNSEKALEQVMQAYSMAVTQNSVQPTPHLFNLLGSLFKDLGEHQEALSYYLQALELASDQDISREQIPILINLGIVSNLLHNYPQELAYYTQALALLTKLGQTSSSAGVLNNMAMSYQAMGDLDTAVTKAKESLKAAKQHNLSTVEATTLCTLGELYLDKQAFDQALAYLQESAQLANQLGFLYIETYSLRKIGETLVHENRLDEALTFLHKAIDLAEQLQNQMELAASHQTLAQVHKRLGNTPQALHHFEQFHELDKKLYQEQADRHIHQLQIVHKTHTIQQEIELYKQKTEELDAYARTVAHDLKQPIAAILGYAELLPEIMSDMPKDGLLYRSLTQIGQSANQASQIINALLLLATVNKAEVPLEPIDMATAVRNVLHRLHEQIHKYQAQIVLPDEWETAVGYQPWIEEVWVNYLTNALKYGGTAPEIILSWEKYAPNMVRFWMQDNGPGIPEEHHEDLFNEFSRVSDSTFGESHGLGLAIVRRIVEKLGGTVGYKPGLTQGSHFFFTLPAQTANPDDLLSKL